MYLRHNNDSIEIALEICAEQDRSDNGNHGKNVGYHELTITSEKFALLFPRLNLKY